MKSSHRSVGLFVVLVAATVLLVGWPRRESSGTPESSDEAAHAEEAVPVFQVEDGMWKLPQYGLKMRLPEGWTPVERRTRPFLFRLPGQLLAGSFNVLALPNLRGENLDQMRVSNLRTFADNDRLEAISIEEVEVSGAPALYVRYKGTPIDKEPMRFEGVILLRGGFQVVVTAAALETDWDELEGAIAEALGSLELL